VSETMEEKKSIPAPSKTKLSMQKRRVEEIRRLTREIEGVAIRSNELSNKLCATVYDWTTDAVKLGMNLTLKGSQRVLANELGIGFDTVHNWFEKGRILKQYDLPVTARHISTIREHRGHVSEGTLKRMIEVARNDSSYGTMARVLAKDISVHQREAKKRIVRMQDHDRVTVEHLRVELNAVLEMASKVFDRDDLMIHVTDQTFAPLYVVGEGKSKTKTA